MRYSSTFNEFGYLNFMKLWIKHRPIFAFSQLETVTAQSQSLERNVSHWWCNKATLPPASWLFCFTTDSLTSLYFFKWSWYIDHTTKFICGGTTSLTTYIQKLHHQNCSIASLEVGLKFHMPPLVKTWILCKKTHPVERLAYWAEIRNSELMQVLFNSLGDNILS